MHDPLESGRIGVLPVGALGVALAAHLSHGFGETGKVVFLERAGSRSAMALRETGQLLLNREGEVETMPYAEWSSGTLREAWEADQLPAVVLVALQPDQLSPLLGEAIDLLAAAWEAGQWEPGQQPPFPAFVLCANGLYFQRVRQVFLEQLEEATLLGHLPDLWPDTVPQLVGRLLRGVTIQTGYRAGAGAAARFTVGIPGPTTLAGGSAVVRRRILGLLAGGAAPYLDAEDRSPTRVEFDKALINMTSNLLGVLYGMDGSAYRALRVGEIYTPEHLEEVYRMVEAMVRIGRAVRAYPSEEVLPVQAHYQRVLDISGAHGSHTPSSVLYVEEHWRAGTLRAEMPPTEAWILRPLLHYARSAGLTDDADLFASYETRLLDGLRGLGAS